MNIFVFISFFTIFSFFSRIINGISFWIIIWLIRFYFLRFSTFPKKVYFLLWFIFTISPTIFFFVIYFNESTFFKFLYKRNYIIIPYSEIFCYYLIIFTFIKIFIFICLFIITNRWKFIVIFIYRLNHSLP